ncbi:MAG: type VII secretion protein EssC [Clostridium sp.]|nr:type VII secretion protein EssC [Clostridium sp.]MCM1207704.1 type VII secretion protein EssC [Ruminococcus sp.]
MDNLCIYFNFKDTIYGFCLPLINNRRFDLNLTNICVSEECIISFEVWDNHWKIKNNDTVTIYDGERQKNEYGVYSGLTLQAFINKTKEKFALIISEYDVNTAKYYKLSLEDKEKITIGSGENNDIVIYDDFVSSEHATLYVKNGAWYISDSSTNGTFINNNRLNSDVKLRVFDELYFMGTKLIFLGNVIAINNCDKIQTRLKLAPVKKIDDAELIKVADAENIVDESYFSRSPREMEPFDDEKVEIEGPPQKSTEKKQPLILTIGPAITMPLPIMLSVMFNATVNSNNNIMLYVGTFVSVIASALIGLVWTLINNKYTKKQNRISEEERTKGYLNYIKKNEKLLTDKHEETKKIMERQYVNSLDLAYVWFNNKNLLWNRNINHSDFLTLRIGIGKAAFPSDINVPKKRFSLLEDDLVEKPRELYERYKYMNDVPSLISLKEMKILGVIGKHENVLSIARNVVIQIAALHCYTDVKIAFLYDYSDNDKLQWIKWLPHVFSNDRKIRYVANEKMSHENVLYELTNVLRTREEKTEQSEQNENVHYVVFCTGAGLIEGSNIYSYITSNKNYDFTFVLLYDEINKLPNECKHIIQWDKEFSGYYVLDKNRDATSRIVFPQISVESCEMFARTISGIHVKESAGGEIPTEISFMEMYNIANLEQWDLIRHYKENRAYEGLTALIGITNGNRPLYLDIHEKKAGPHGLIAGTTGSGKSELIMTFILSLVMNYPPDEVAFVLIDYKGGGMAVPFMGLPHIVGTITNIDSDDGENLDENQARRALISIKSEIKRRQRIFNKYNLNHIDTYIKLYRNGETVEALPHLIIISDEFAELKKEQPEFIKELVSAARVGRSLGIHLILATQKPAGVVDDEIWSNSRFKVCLRVQDKQDSQGMLKRPEAAYITGVGRAYIQIGNDEIFEMFQSGYAGAPYMPREKLELPQHNIVSMISIDGIDLYSKPTVRGNSKQISQLDACVDYVKNVTKKNGIHGARQLWLPTLKKYITYNEVLSLYNVDFSAGLVAMYGLTDYPEGQKQFPATIDFLNTANVIVAGAIGTGKSTLVQTLLYSLVNSYGPNMVNMYCFDFSSRTMKVFQNMPHFGNICFSEEQEKVERNIKLIQDTMIVRQKAFDDIGVGNFNEARKISMMPLILVFIDNYALFKQLYPEIDEEMVIIAREGVKYGIQIIVTVNSENDMGYKLRQNFSDVITLYYGDKSKYYDFIGHSVEFVPQNMKGRGLIETGGMICEYQTLIAVNSHDESERILILKNELENIAERYSGYEMADIVKTIPEEEYYEYISRNYECHTLPIGYNMEDISKICVDLKDIYCYSITSNAVDSKQMVFDNLCYATKFMGYEGYNLSNDISKQCEGMRFINLSSEFSDMFDLALYLKEVFTYRNKEMKRLREIGEQDTFFQNNNHIIILIDDLMQFCESIYEGKHLENLYPIMETFCKKGKGLGVHFIAYVDRASYYQTVTYEFAKIFKDYQTGLHFGGNLNEQKMHKFEMPDKVQDILEDNNIFYHYERDRYVHGYMPR